MRTTGGSVTRASLPAPLPGPLAPALPSLPAPPAAGSWDELNTASSAMNTARITRIPTFMETTSTSDVRFTNCPVAAFCFFIEAALGALVAVGDCPPLQHGLHASRETGCGLQQVGHDVVALDPIRVHQQDRIALLLLAVVVARHVAHL